MHYKVKVKLCLGPLGGDVVAELPFILMHPKPIEETCSAASTSKSPGENAQNDRKENNANANENPEEPNLIQLDA